MSHQSPDLLALSDDHTIIHADKHKNFKLRSPSELQLLTKNEVQSALKTDKTSIDILSKEMTPKIGDKVGARLNLNVLKNTGVLVNSIHLPTNENGYKNHKGWYRGKVVHYEQAITLRNAYFNVDQKARLQIASGASSKFPMASCDGELMTLRSKNFNGVAIRFNPAKEHLFVDEDGYAVRFAEEVTVFGHRAFARGMIAYYKNDNIPAATQGYQSQAKALT